MLIKIAIIVPLLLIFYLYFWPDLMTLLAVLIGLILYPQIFSKIKLYYKPSPRMSSIISRIPSIQGRYYPTFWLFHGILQLFFGATFGGSPGPSRFCESVTYNRELMTLPDQSLISIDWAFPNTSESPSKIIIMVPGLASNSSSPNTRCLVVDAIKKQYTVAVVHGQGICAPLKTPKFYSLCFWKDLGFVIDKIQEKFPNALLFGCGPSMGGGNLLRYAAEMQEKCPLKGLATVACALDVHSVTKINSQGSGLAKFGDNLLLEGLKKIYLNMKEQLKEINCDVESLGIIEEEVLSAKSALEFDDKCTAKLCSLKNAKEYYDQITVLHMFDHLKIPVFCMNALDDPIIPSVTLPIDLFRHHENVILATTITGGHVGFYSGHITPHRWYPVPVLEFFEAIQE